MSRDSQRHQATNKPTVYALAVEYRLLYTLIVYYLAPRDLHHDDPIEVDLYLMFTLKENVRIDWPHLLLLNMLGFSTSSDALGYLILISRIIEHALVDVSDTGYLINDPQENLILGHCSLFTAKLQFTNYSSETPILHGVVNMNMFNSATIAHRELFITERADPHFIKFVNSILEDEEDLESYLAPKTFWALQVEDVFGNFSNQDCSALQSC
ncbi:hypothetical protein Lal_00011134 [Lupinus albus]|nr:hypothetical protein Lal_00011134 [Lupinus albus]